MRRAAIVGLMLLLGLVGTACGEPSDEGSGDSAAPPTESPGPDDPVIGLSSAWGWWRSRQHEGDDGDGS